MYLVFKISGFAVMLHLILLSIQLFHLHEGHAVDHKNVRVVDHQEVAVDLVKGAHLGQRHDVNPKIEVSQGDETGPDLIRDTNLKIEVDQEIPKIEVSRREGTDLGPILDANQKIKVDPENRKIEVYQESTGLDLILDANQTTEVDQEIREDLDQTPGAGQIEVVLVKDTSLDLFPDMDQGLVQSVGLALGVEPEVAQNVGPGLAQKINLLIKKVHLIMQVGNGHQEVVVVLGQKTEVAQMSGKGVKANQADMIQKVVVVQLTVCH